MLSFWALEASPKVIFQHSKHNISCALLQPKLADEATLASASGSANLEKPVVQQAHSQYLFGLFERGIEAYKSTFSGITSSPARSTRSVYLHLHYHYVHSIMHFGLCLEFDRPSILVNGPAEIVVVASTAEDRLLLLNAYRACKEDTPITNFIYYSLVGRFKGSLEEPCGDCA